MIRVKGIKGDEYTVSITRDDPLWQDYYNKWLDHKEGNVNIKEVEEARNKLADKVIEIIYAEQEKRIIKEISKMIKIKEDKNESFSRTLQSRNGQTVEGSRNQG